MAGASSLGDGIVVFTLIIVAWLLMVVVVDRSGSGHGDGDVFADGLEALVGRDGDHGGGMVDVFGRRWGLGGLGNAHRLVRCLIVAVAGLVLVIVITAAAVVRGWATRSVDDLSDGGQEGLGRFASIGTVTLWDAGRARSYCVDLCGGLGGDDHRANSRSNSDYFGNDLADAIRAVGNIRRTACDSRDAGAVHCRGGESRDRAIVRRGRHRCRAGRRRDCYGRVGEVVSGRDGGRSRSGF